MDYQLSSTSGNGSFDLLDAQGTLLTAFHYANWFSSIGSGSIGNSQITIKPRNLWHSAFDIRINGTNRGSITVNWQGHILIRFEVTPGLATNYRLKSQGLWRWQFVLEDEQHTVLLQLEPTYQWNKMGYSYSIEVAAPVLNNDDPSLPALMLICGYGANLYMTMSSVAATS